MALRAGADGIVCSAADLPTLGSSDLPEGCIVVTPGIRPSGPDGDQRRVATPAEAVRFGATLLVVGRPIREASDPRAAVHAIRAQMNAR